MLDPQVQAVLDEERALHAVDADGGAASGPPSIAARRAGYGATTERFGGSGPAMARELERAIPGSAGPLPVHVYVPAGTEAGAERAAAAAARPGVVVYLHGGGWALGTLAALHPVCRHVAAASGAVVVAVDYRLAPEHPFPAGVEDAFAAVRWVAAHAGELGADPGRVAVMGDSSGANLATVAARRLAAEDVALRAQVLVYPVTDAARDTASYARYAEGFRLDAAEMAWFWERYLDGADGRDPDASPLYASLAGLPPTSIVLAEHDVLHDEGAAYAVRLREAGVPVQCVVVPGTVHGFIRWPAAVDAAERALADVGAMLRRALA